MKKIISYGKTESLIFKIKFKLATIFRVDLNRQRFREINIGEYKLLTNELHYLDRYIANHPKYSQNLPNISKIVKTKYPDHEILDVGANIGDTVALIRTAGVNNYVHCIEGLEYYYFLLKINIKNIEGSISYNYFLSDNDREGNFDINIKEGTADIIKNKDSKTKIKNLTTLDKFIAKNKIKNIKLLKIDTDGYDIKILDGGKKTLRQNKPVIFFEYDPFFLANTKTDPFKIFYELEDMGYTKILFYNNYGHFIVTIDIKNKKAIYLMYKFVNSGYSKFEYYDVCVTHKNDEDIAIKIENFEAQNI